jgi:branched-chain amino acid transport system ATP-binding protein
MALLEVEDLDAGYETGQVLFEVDLRVERGEVVSLLGRNGAGKTTTMYSIMGTTPPNVTDGAIRFDGTNLVGKRPFRRAQKGISLVPEERRLWPRLTVRETIRMAINNAENPKSMEAVLEYFPTLKQMTDKKAMNMSGGEQQMLAIARGLAANPQLMLLDEPSEGLAPFIVRDVERAIREINGDEDITILLVEQNLAMTMNVSNNHYIIDRGHIRAEKTSGELEEDESLRQEYLSV